MKPQTINFLLLASLLALGACGGGGGGGVDSGGIGGTGIVATGVMTNGSIILNSVHYDDNNVNNVSDDPLGGTSTSPDDGKVVKLRGRRNDDGINGTAETVEVENEVRGTVQSTNAGATPQSFNVVNQTVTIDDLTICSNFTLPASSVGAPTFRCNDPLPELGSGTVVVEVHGLRLADGSIRASRIERLGIGAGTGFDELRGTVDSAGVTSFTLVNGSPVQNVAVTYSGTPPVTNGQLVEVHGAFNGTVFNATRVDIEDIEDSEFIPGNNGEVEREGFVADCGTPGCTTFTVSGQPVETTSDVRFENGAKEDLIDGVRIEAEGHFISSTGKLLADEIKFKRVKVEVTGSATLTGTVPGGGTIHIMGITILTNDLTEVETSDSITDERLEIRGYVDSADQIIAERVKDDVGGGSDQIIRGPVTTKAGSTLTAVGVDVLLTGSTVLQDGAISDLSQFLSLITAAPSPGGTVVKAKGSFAGTLTADEAEIED